VREVTERRHFGYFNGGKKRRGSQERTLKSKRADSFFSSVRELRVWVWV
jgi:hypothetical protein